MMGKFKLKDAKGNQIDKKKTLQNYKQNKINDLELFKKKYYKSNDLFYFLEEPYIKKKMTNVTPETSKISIFTLTALTNKEILKINELRNEMETIICSKKN